MTTKNYFNQAGTTWPKPAPVLEAMNRAALQAPTDWSATFDSAHQELAQYFGIPDPARLLLTPGCTSALSLAVADMPWEVGDRAICSAFEHHALHRPLLKLVQQGVDLEVIAPTETGPFNLAQLRNSLQRHPVKLVAVSAASNVTGECLPLDDILELAHAYGAKVLVDAAQVVGWFEIDVVRSGFDLFAFGGHKGLHAPWGIGGLYVAPHVELQTPKATCDVGDSSQPQCTPMPGYCDGGSVDRMALACLPAAIDWLSHRPDRLEIARQRLATIHDALRKIPGIVIYGTSPFETRMPTIAFNMAGKSAGAVAQWFAQQEIILSSGLQCAPLAHEILGSAPQGVARVSLGPQNTDQDVEALCRVLGKLAAS